MQSIRPGIAQPQRGEQLAYCTGCASEAVGQNVAKKLRRREVREKERPVISGAGEVEGKGKRKREDGKRKR